jgi:glycosyltransferase involved in cell wall biosynthesis
MASGVPVISSNTGGIPEVNINGVSGFLSKVGDVNDMTKNALHILSNNNRLNTFKINARKQSLNFDLHKIVPQYEVIYEDTLAKCLVL